MYLVAIDERERTVMYDGPMADATDARLGFAVCLEEQLLCERQDTPPPGDHVQIAFDSFDGIFMAVMRGEVTQWRVFEVAGFWDVEANEEASLPLPSTLHIVAQGGCPM